MEKTNDENFVSHNSSKPFIRTMEDDLKKIKNNPAGSKSKAAIISSLSSASLKSSVPHGGIDRPASSAVPFQASVSVPPLDIDPASPSVAPKNLPVEKSFVEKEKQSKEENEKAEQARIENEKIKQANIERETVERAQIDKEKERLAQASKPVVPISENDFSLRPQNTGRLSKESEALSPEARLARQSSSDIEDSEKKESLATPSSTGTPLAVPKRFDKTVKSFNSVSSIPPSLDSKKKSIEEIIKEDSPSSYLKKFIKVFFAILFIFGIIVGSYYFYFAKEPLASQSYTEAFISDVAEVIIETDLNTDLGSEVRQYFSSSTQSGMYRLIIKDKNGQNNLGLENFSNSLNIVLPDYIASALEEDYNLIVFNYPEKNYLRLGLIFKVKNSSRFSDFVQNWEMDMYRNTEAMFVGDAGVYDAKKQFGNNRHNNFNIRYLPLGSENAALNYAIDDENKFLLIAASKQDIFNLIDNIIEGK